MAVELSPGLRTLFLVLVGEEWPTGDEDSMRELAELWDGVAAVLLEVEADVAVAWAAAKAAGSAEGLGGIQDYLGKLADHGGAISKLRDATMNLAESARKMALEIEYAKTTIVLMLTYLAYELAQLALAVYASGGMLAPAYPVLYAKAREGVEWTLARAAYAISRGIGFNTSFDILAQLYQFARKHRRSWDWSKSANSMQAGLFGAPASMLASKATSGLGRVLTDRNLVTGQFGLATVVLVRKMVEEAAGETVPEIVMGGFGSSALWALVSGGGVEGTIEGATTLFKAGRRHLHQYVNLPSFKTPTLGDFHLPEPPPDLEVDSGDPEKKPLDAKDPPPGPKTDPKISPKTDVKTDPKTGKPVDPKQAASQEWSFDTTEALQEPLPAYDELPQAYESLPAYEPGPTLGESVVTENGIAGNTDAPARSIPATTTGLNQPSRLPTSHAPSILITHPESRSTTTTADFGQIPFSRFSPQLEPTTFSVSDPRAIDHILNPGKNTTPSEISTPAAGASSTITSPQHTTPTGTAVSNTNITSLNTSTNINTSTAIANVLAGETPAHEAATPTGSQDGLVPGHAGTGARDTPVVAAGLVPHDVRKQLLIWDYGWLGDVNPYRIDGGEFTTNCVLTGIATDLTLATGETHQAGASGLTAEEELANYRDRPPSVMADYAQVVTELRRAGPGARGMVVIYQGGTIGHLVNVVHDPKHGIVFLDGEAGSLATLPDRSTEIQFLRTDLPASPPQQMKVPPRTGRFLGTGNLDKEAVIATAAKLAGSDGSVDSRTVAERVTGQMFPTTDTLSQVASILSQAGYNREAGGAEAVAGSSRTGSHITHRPRRRNEGQSLDQEDIEAAEAFLLDGKYMIQDESLVDEIRKIVERSDAQFLKNPGPGLNVLRAMDWGRKRGLAVSATRAIKHLKALAALPSRVKSWREKQAVDENGIGEFDDVDRPISVWDRVRGKLEIDQDIAIGIRSLRSGPLSLGGGSVTSTQEQIQGDLDVVETSSDSSEQYDELAGPVVSGEFPIFDDSYMVSTGAVTDVQNLLKDLGAHLVDTDQLESVLNALLALNYARGRDVELTADHAGVYHNLHSGDLDSIARTWRGQKYENGSAWDQVLRMLGITEDLNVGRSASSGSDVIDWSGEETEAETPQPTRSETAREALALLDLEDSPDLDMPSEIDNATNNVVDDTMDDVRNNAGGLDRTAVLAVAAEFAGSSRAALHVTLPSHRNTNQPPRREDIDAAEALAFLQTGEFLIRPGGERSPVEVELPEIMESQGTQTNKDKGKGKLDDSVVITDVNSATSLGLIDPDSSTDNATDDVIENIVDDAAESVAGSSVDEIMDNVADDAMDDVTENIVEDVRPFGDQRMAREVRRAELEYEEPTAEQQAQHDAEMAELARWQAVDDILGQENLAQPYTKPGSGSVIETVLQVYPDRIAEVLGANNVSVQMSPPLDFTVANTSIQAVRDYLGEVLRDEFELRRRQEGTPAKHTGAFTYTPIPTATLAQKAIRQRDQETVWVSEVETAQTWSNEAGDRVVRMLVDEFNLPLTVISAELTSDIGPDPGEGSVRQKVTVLDTHYQPAVPAAFNPPVVAADPVGYRLRHRKRSAEELAVTWKKFETDYQGYRQQAQALLAGLAARQHPDYTRLTAEWAAISDAYAESKRRMDHRATLTARSIYPPVGHRRELVEALAGKLDRFHTELVGFTTTTGIGVGRGRTGRTRARFRVGGRAGAGRHVVTVEQRLRASNVLVWDDQGHVKTAAVPRLRAATRRIARAQLAERGWVDFDEVTTKVFTTPTRRERAQVAQWLTDVGILATSRLEYQISKASQLAAAALAANQPVDAAAIAAEVLGPPPEGDTGEQAAQVRGWLESLGHLPQPHLDPQAWTAFRTATDISTNVNLGFHAGALFGDGGTVAQAHLKGWMEAARIGTAGPVVRRAVQADAAVGLALQYLREGRPLDQNALTTITSQVFTGFQPDRASEVETAVAVALVAGYIEGAGLHTVWPRSTTPEQLAAAVEAFFAIPVSQQAATAAITAQVFGADTPENRYQLMGLLHGAGLLSPVGPDGPRRRMIKRALTHASTLLDTGRTLKPTTGVSLTDITRYSYRLPRTTAPSAHQMTLTAFQLETRGMLHAAPSFTARHALSDQQPVQEEFADQNTRVHTPAGRFASKDVIATLRAEVLDRAYTQLAQQNWVDPKRIIAELLTTGPGSEHRYVPDWLVKAGITAPRTALGGWLRHVRARAEEILIHHPDDLQAGEEALEQALKTIAGELWRSGTGSAGGHVPRLRAWLQAWGLLTPDQEERNQIVRAQAYARRQLQDGLIPKITDTARLVFGLGERATPSGIQHMKVEGWLEAANLHGEEALATLHGDRADTAVTEAHRIILAAQRVLPAHQLFSKEGIIELIEDAIPAITQRVFNVQPPQGTTDVQEGLVQGYLEAVGVLPANDTRLPGALAEARRLLVTGKFSTTTVIKNYLKFSTGGTGGQATRNYYRAYGWLYASGLMGPFGLNGFRARLAQQAVAAARALPNQADVIDDTGLDIIIGQVFHTDDPTGYQRDLVAEWLEAEGIVVTTRPASTHAVPHPPRPVEDELIAEGITVRTDRTEDRKLTPAAVVRLSEEAARRARDQLARTGPGQDYVDIKALVEELFVPTGRTGTEHLQVRLWLSWAGILPRTRLEAQMAYAYTRARTILTQHPTLEAGMAALKDELPAIATGLWGQGYGPDLERMVGWLEAGLMITPGELRGDEMGHYMNDTIAYARDKRASGEKPTLTGVLKDVFDSLEGSPEAMQRRARGWWEAHGLHHNEAVYTTQAETAVRVALKMLGNGQPIGYSTTPDITRQVFGLAADAPTSGKQRQLILGFLEGAGIKESRGTKDEIEAFHHISGVFAQTPGSLGNVAQGAFQTYGDKQPHLYGQVYGSGLWGHLKPDGARFGMAQQAIEAAHTLLAQGNNIHAGDVYTIASRVFHQPAPTAYQRLLVETWLEAAGILVLTQPVTAAVFTGTGTGATSVESVLVAQGVVVRTRDGLLTPTAGKVLRKAVVERGRTHGQIEGWVDVETVLAEVFAQPTATERRQAQVWLSQAGITKFSQLKLRIAATVAEVEGALDSGEQPGTLDLVAVAAAALDYPEDGPDPTAVETQHVLGWAQAARNGQLWGNGPHTVLILQAVQAAKRELARHGKVDLDRTIPPGLNRDDPDVRELVTGWLESYDLYGEGLTFRHSRNADAVVRKIGEIRTSGQPVTATDLTTITAEMFGGITEVQQALVLGYAQGFGALPAIELTPELTIATQAAAAALTSGQPVDVDAITDQTFPDLAQAPQLRVLLRALVTGWLYGAGLLGTLPASAARALLIEEVLSGAEFLTHTDGTLGPAALHTLTTLVFQTPEVSTYQLGLVATWLDTHGIPVTAELNPSATKDSVEALLAHRGLTTRDADGKLTPETVEVLREHAARLARHQLSEQNWIDLKAITAALFPRATLVGKEYLQVRIWLNQAGITTGSTSLLQERIATAAEVATGLLDNGETIDVEAIARQVFGVTPTTGQVQQVRGWLHVLELLDPDQQLPTVMATVLAEAENQLNHPGALDATALTPHDLGEPEGADLVLGWLQARHLTPDTAETYFATQADKILTEALTLLDNQQPLTVDTLGAALYGVGYVVLHPTQRAFTTAVLHGASLLSPTITHTDADLSTQFAAALTHARTLLATGQPLDIPALADRLFPNTPLPDQPTLHALVAGWLAGAGLLGPLPATGGRAILITRLAATAHELAQQNNNTIPAPAAVLAHVLPALITALHAYQLDWINTWIETAI